MIRRFVKQYKYYILVPAILFIALTIASIVLPTGPQMRAFIYQVF